MRTLAILNLVVSLICAVIITYTITIAVYANRTLLGIKSYTPNLQLNYDVRDCPYSHSEIKNKLDKLYGNPFYFYKEKNLNDRVLGNADLLIRVVTIDNTPKLSGYVYAYALSHELTHIITLCGDEANTEYKSIIKLYESGDPYFMEVAKWATMNRIQNYGKNGGYECGYYLQEYFRNI